MTEDGAELLRAERRGGHVPLRLLLRFAGDLLRSVPREWVRVASERRRKSESGRAGRETPRKAEARTWPQDLVLDLRYALRSFAGHKGFTVTAVSALALGIGANTAIFSVVSGVVLRPLPFAEPDRLVQLYGTPAERGEAIAWADLEELRAQATSFEVLVGYGVTARYLGGSERTERVMAVAAERPFFATLGVGVIAGRTFQADDPANVAVASEAFWRRRLGGDPSIIGRVVTLDGEPFTIVGVMPASFQFPYGAASLLPGVASEARTDLWIPLVPTPQPGRRSPPGRLSYVTGRLRNDVALGAAASEAAVIFERLAAQYPDTNRGVGVRLVPLAEAVVAAPLRRSLFMLFGSVGIVLALACANVANLSLVRMTMRSREVAVRTALGAGPLRLLRQFSTESLLLSLAGGLAGVALAWWGTDRLLALVGDRIPRAHEVGLDWRVFAFLLATCVLTAVLVGLIPAASVLRRNVQSTVRQSGTASTMNGGQRRLRDGLVVAEVALAMALCVGATLLVRELARLHQTETGMETGNVLVLHVGGPRSAADARRLYEIAELVARLPGVREAAFTQLLPLQNWGWSANTSDFEIVGRPATEPPPIASMELRYVTPGYFRALGIPIRRGRAFTPGDDDDAPPVILINETLARAYFGDRDPTGAETSRGTIAGVVGDVRQMNLDRPALPEVYYPIAQNWSQVRELGMSLVVSAEGRAEPLIDPIRETIRRVGPDLAVFDVDTMDGVLAASLSEFTLYLGLVAAFAVLAIVLATTGTYGVVSYVATSRLRELAIRSALGAGQAQVTRLIFGQAVRLTALGLLLGVGGAFAAAPLLRDLPVSVRGPDLSIIAPVAALLGAVAIAASLVPARRAARVDPIYALRRDS
jgi:predicted permease